MYQILIKSRGESGVAKTGTYKQMITLQRAHIVTWKAGSMCVQINVILEKKRMKFSQKN